MRAVAAQVSRLGEHAGIQDLREALTQAGLQVSFDFTHRHEGRIGAQMPAAQRNQALQIGVASLRRSGYRVCFERRGAVWSVFAFPTRAGLGLHLQLRALRLFDAAPRIAPYFALVGPDGVGKSTVLRLICERIKAEGPFFNISLKQWRPGLLPSLASLAGRPEANEGAPSDFRPRRDPGNLQFLRLSYYGLDFAAGSYWKHREASGARLIIYDRCALDMVVDPYRFGLRSRWGTGALWKMVPKPAGIILLHDSEGRIARRKDDLTVQEIREQTAFWLELVKDGTVSSVVQVEDDARETANRVYQILIDQFLGCHEQICPQNSGETLRAVRGSLLQAREGNRSEKYGLFPNQTDTRFLIPFANARASAAALDLYPAQKPLARAAKSLLTCALRTGAAAQLWPHCIQLCTADLENRFGDLLGQDVRLAFSLGSGNSRRRLIIQLATPGGEILAYAKAGLDESSRTAIRREEQSLRLLEQAGFSAAEAPHILGSFAWRDAWILAETPGPRHQKPAPGLEDGLVQYLARLASAFPCAAPAVRLGSDSAAHLKDLGYPYYADLVDWAADHLAGFTELPGSFVHGDFTPWNVSVSRSGVFAFDWEQAAYPGVVAWDAFHFCIASSVEIRGHSPAETFRDVIGPGHMNRMILRYFEAAGINPSLLALLFIRYLAGALTNSVLADPAGADGKEEAMRRTWAFLLVLMRHCVRRDARAEASR
jgi:hypothetical protein